MLAVACSLHQDGFHLPTGGRAVKIDERPSLLVPGQPVDIVAIEGVDTRELTRHLRTHGAQRGAISTVDLDPERLIGRVRESPS